MKTYKIHLIRHGLTDGNLQEKYIGCKTDLPLCPEGVDELRQLRETVDYPDIERLYASPLLRCRQTAAILYPDTEVHAVDSLTEYDFGTFEGKTANQLEIDPTYLDWAAGKIDAPPEGESSSDFIKRQCYALHEIVQDMMDHDVTNAAAIMHGGAIMMLLAACAVPRKPAVEWTSENGCGYSVLITPSLYHSSGVIEVYDVI